jgi:hypothetical protein
MCAAKDAVASEWYSTNEEKKKNLFFRFFPDKGGNLCIETPRSMPGIDAMRRGTAAVVKSGANVGKQLYYYPEDARAVSNFYGGCVGECACTDRLVRTKDGSQVCHIADEGVRIFFFPIPGCAFLPFLFRIPQNKHRLSSCFLSVSASISLSPLVFFPCLHSLPSLLAYHHKNRLKIINMSGCGPRAPNPRKHMLRPGASGDW